MSLLYPVYNELVEYESVSHVSDMDEQQSFIDSCYSKIVDSSKYSADLQSFYAIRITISFGGQKN